MPPEANGLSIQVSITFFQNSVNTEIMVFHVQLNRFWPF